jgi:hypothetical protein
VKCNELFKNEKVRAWLRERLEPSLKGRIVKLSPLFRSGKTPEGGVEKIYLQINLNALMV